MAVAQIIAHTKTEHVWVNWRPCFDTSTYRMIQKFPTVKNLVEIGYSGQNRAKASILLLTFFRCERDKDIYISQAFTLKRVRYGVLHSTRPI